MRGLSMHINNKAFFMNILLAGVLGLFSANAYAVVTLSDDIEAPDAVADEENDSTETVYFQDGVF